VLLGWSWWGYRFGWECFGIHKMMNVNDWRIDRW
jgi:hypothetical protein